MVLEHYPLGIEMADVHGIKKENQKKSKVKRFKKPDKMLRRPKLGETEEELLKQQEDFLKASGKQQTFKRKILENEEEIPKHVEILGDIVEKNPAYFEPLPNPQQIKGFPKSFTIDNSIGQKKKGKKSLFALQMKKNKKNAEETEMEEAEAVGGGSITEPSEFREEVYEENLEKLSKMSEKEILDEQKKLLETLDPNLLKFLKNRNKRKDAREKPQEVDVENVELDQEEIKKKLEKYVDSRWLNMDFLEKEKLEWIGDIPDKKALERDQPYSARFDFKGDLQPFAAEIDVRSSLYHHGDEPNRPGYTIQELYQLLRSQVLQQRILALKTLANIIRKTKLGYYDRCFDGQLLHKLVESDLFFLLRFSFDDNPLVPASVHCLHNLICNESDEFCLDKLLGTTYADEQPLLFNKIETSKDEETELKDHVVIGCDMIKGVLRTDLLIRLAYVLGNFSPNRETVVRAINCLIRISRHSMESAKKIFETPKLLNIVYANIKTNEPVYEGIKLLRVMITQSKTLAIEIIRKFDVKFLVSFIEAEEISNISKKEFYLLKLETIYFWKGLLVHHLFVNEFVMWSPCLVRLLLFYTQKVDVSAENDFDFELFSAMASLLIVYNRKKIPPEPNIIVMMRICLEKWLTQLIQRCRYNFAVSKAVGCAFRYFTSYFKAFGVNTLDSEFIKKINSIIISLFQSEVFGEMSNALRTHSHVLSLTEVTRDPENLPSLCSVYDGGDEFLKLVQNPSALPFFTSLVKYLKAAHRVSHDSKFIIKLFTDCTKIQKYVSKVCRCRTKKYNWFVKYETAFLTNYLQLLSLLGDGGLMSVGFRLLPLLRVDDKNSEKVLNIIFDKIHWKGDVGFVNRLGPLYSKLLFQGQSGGMNYKNESVPEDWMYKILTLLRGKEAVTAVTDVLKFISLMLHQNPELLHRVPHTFRFYHMCSVFLTDSNVFDSEIQNALEETFKDVVTSREKVDLNVKLGKNKSFYDLYTELITQYAGVSYGLPIFAQFVLFPLQNRFNVSFRKLIWFEYLHVLRVILIPFPVSGFVDLKDFIEPSETDESLLVAYVNSVSNNVISKKRNPFVYNVAIGNVKNFLQRKDGDEKLLMFLKKKVNDLKNVELKNDILNFGLCS